MPPYNIIRGQTFRGTIDLKQILPVGSANVFPYIIPVGAVLEVHLPPDTNASPEVTSLILSSVNPLPNPPYGVANEVAPYDDGVTGELTGVSFVCTPTKCLQLLVGPNLAVDLWVVKDPSTRLNIDIFEAASVINVADPLNP